MVVVVGWAQGSLRHMEGGSREERRALGNMAEIAFRVSRRAAAWCWRCRSRPLVIWGSPLWSLSETPWARGRARVSALSLGRRQRTPKRSANREPVMASAKASQPTTASQSRCADRSGKLVSSEKLIPAVREHSHRPEMKSQHSQLYVEIRLRFRE